MKSGAYKQIGIRRPEKVVSFPVDYQAAIRQKAYATLTWTKLTSRVYDRNFICPFFIMEEVEE